MALSFSSVGYKLYKMKKSIFLLGIAIAVTLAGYSRFSLFQESLFQKKWSLQQINSKDSAIQVRTKAFIQFDNIENRVSGNSSCNIFGGSFSVAKNTIAFQQLFSTKMYCENVQSIEDLFLQSLSRIDGYTIKGNTLHLLADGQVVLIFSGTDKEEGAR